MCRLFSLNSQKYYNLVKPFIGGIFLGSGFILTFFGAMFLFQFVAAAFALFVTGVLFLLSYNFFLPHDNVPVLIAYLFMCSVVAVYISFQCYSFAKTWAVCLISAWGGLALGLILIKLTFITNATLTLLCGILSSVAGAYFGKKLNLLVRCCGTAVFGSSLIIKGMNDYLGGLPANLMSGEELVSGDLEYTFYLYLFGFVWFAIYGCHFQMKHMKAKSDDDYNYSQDEGCGC